MDDQVLILGGGPKGIALAAKHSSLDNAGLPNYLILERFQLGAHWTGSNGYTDGNQRLVSPPEQDIGYPYKSQKIFGKQGKDINSRMQNLSWFSHLVSVGGLIDWINDGRPNPTHKQFVRYLEWVADSIEANHKVVNVETIEVKDSRWLLSDKNRSFEEYGNGLVITGNGGPKRLRGRGYDNNRVTDGRDFWDKLGVLQDLNRGNTVGVVGSGETAGAIASVIVTELQKLGLDQGDDPVEVILICRHPSYFLRSDVAKDLKWFSDPVGWNSLNLPQKKGVIRRADRGVVSGHVKRKLELSNCVRYLVADTDWPEDYDVPETGPVRLQLNYDTSDDEAVERDKTEELEFDFLVFAWGFDDLWFLELFENSLLIQFMQNVVDQANTKSIESILSQGEKGIWKTKASRCDLPELLALHVKDGSVKRWINRRLEHIIEEDLSVLGFTPKLHLPRLAGIKQGPGIPNLNCLGILSDRIWDSYLTKTPGRQII